MIVGRYLGTVYLLAVYLAPGIDDVGKDEGHEERHPEYGVEGEITAAPYQWHRQPVRLCTYCNAHIPVHRPNVALKGTKKFPHL